MTTDDQTRTDSEYQQLFAAVKTRDGLSETLRVALDIRKFEIELYWKRAAYFWTLIAAIFAAYFLLGNAGQPSAGGLLVVSCIGLLVSLAWYLVNRGSKYWQTNWERHVDLLEDKVIGPLYKTTLAKEDFPFARLHDGYPFQ